MMPINEELSKELEQAVNSIVEESKSEDTQTDEKEDGNISGTISGSDIGSVDSDTSSDLQDVEKTEEQISEEAVTDDKAQEVTQVEEKTEYISDETIARAIGAGIPLTDVFSFPNENSLKRVISAVEDVRSRSKKEDVIEEKVTVDPFAALPKLNAENYDPEVLQYLDGLKEIVKKQQEQIQSTYSRYNEVQRSEQTRHAQEVEDWFDKQVEQLGEDFSDSLGKGRYRSLAQGSPQFANREAIAEKMSVILSGYNAMGKQAPTREEVFDMAIGIVLSGKLQDIKERKLAKELDNRASQHIQRAGGRRAAGHKSPMDEAAEALSEKFGI